MLDLMATAPVRYSPVAPDSRIFRLATEGGAHLPSGQTLPHPEWLRPTDTDVAEAQTSRRRPGLSIWVVGLVTPGQARAIAGRPPNPSKEPAFEASMADVRAASHPFPIEAVHDPDPTHAPQPGWHGHALLEGLHRPSGESKAAYRSLRARIVGVFLPRND